MSTTPLRRTLAALAGAAALLVPLGAAPAVAAQPDVTILGTGAPGAIKDSYIVVLADGVTASGHAAALARKYSGSAVQTWDAALHGFEARLTEKQALRLAADPAVASVEQNATVALAATQSSPPSWGLDRIDQASLPLNSSYTYPTTGSGVTVYIVDTGILTTHSDFGGRAVSGYDFVNNDSNATDCNGHGTHVAGTVGGTAYGVAKGVRLVGVRVLNCSGSGTNAGVIAGINWVTSDHDAGEKAVANMSLGGSRSTTINNAVAAAVADGVTFAVAAGNESTDACTKSPASTATAITVAATTSTDARASYSNYGTCVDIFAPGSSIKSAWYTSTTATNTISGTSMASPHVAGAAALVLALHPTYTPAQVGSALVAGAVTGKVTSAGTGSPNRLLQVTAL